MQYKVVKDSKLPRLVKQVNQHLAEGWKPQGGVAHTLCEEYKTDIFLQALVYN